MKIQFLILIIFITNIFSQREKLQIANVENPNFKPKELKNLVFAFNHMKHGASSPCYGLNGYYGDLFDQQWEGYCELTKKGFLQLFKLGKIYQQRFYTLLNMSDPDINKIRSYASQANKTLMSSNALFYGMYIDKNTPIEEQITVPVRNFKNYDGDDLIPIFYYGDSNNCKGWKKMVEVNIIKNNQNENDNRFTKFFNTYKDVFDSFIFDERITDGKNSFEKVKLLCNSYISNYYDERYKNIEIFKNLNYTEEQFYNLYYDCLDITLYYYINIEYGGEAKNVPIIILSELINDMLNYMDDAIDNPHNATKLLNYIGHDSTLAGLQIILEKAFDVPPKLMNFASNQLFLLYKVSDNENEVDKNYEVRYFYNDQLSLVKNYEEFKEALLNLMKVDHNLQLFCNGLKPYDYLVLFLLSAIIILFISIVSVCTYYRNTIFNKKIYMSLKEEPKEKSVEIKN